MAAQNNLAEFKTAATMSSREIAELTGKELAHVHRDIRSMLDELKKDDPNLDHPQEDKDARGYTTCFHLNRELTETLLTGYSATARRKVIQRWHQLEEQVAQPLEAPEVRSLSTQLAIARLFNVPLHMAQVEAVKVVKLETGTDLSPWLKLAPAQSNLQIEDVFLEPNDLAKRLGISSGTKLNRVLHDAGLQYGGAGNWQPAAEAKNHTTLHQWKNGSKSGVNLKWRLSFVESQLAGMLAKA